MAQEQSTFIGDIVPDDGSAAGAAKTLAAVLIRSPAARGILEDIEVPPLPKGVSLIRARDIPGRNVFEPQPGYGGGADARLLPENTGFPVLAVRELFYAGQPVAILAGPDVSALRELAAACRVIAAEETPVFDHLLSEQTAARRVFSAGAVTEAFEKAGHVIEGTYNTGFQEAWAADPNGAAAFPLFGQGGSAAAPEGIVIYAASQWPFHVRESAARVLGIRPDMAEIRAARLGFQMDAKLFYSSLCACYAALAAWITRRPVKFIPGRDEDFRFSPKRVKTEIRLKTALGGDGRILGTELAVSADMGAAGFYAEEILDHIVLGALGAYHHGALNIDARAALTNVPPAGPLAGFGMAQGFFAMERHASRIADALGEDPAEWRKNVFLQKGTKLAIGSEIREQVSLEGLIDMAVSMSDYRRKWAAFELIRRSEGRGLRGIGLATAFQANGLLYPPGDKQGVELTLEKDGCLEIRTSMTCAEGELRPANQKGISGEGGLSPLKIIAARKLGIDENQIRIVTGGKQAVNSGPACLSRNIAVISRLVARSCEAITKQRFRDPLPITVRRFYYPAKSKAWNAGTLYDENSLSCLSWGCAVVEAEIDPVEYLPKVRGIWLAVDGGPIISEHRARKSLTLLSIQALNWAARESVSYRDGIIPPEQTGDYPLPPVEEIPPIRIDFQWSEGASRGIGELPFNTIPAAYMQAISQAIDHPFAGLPAGAADIWRSFAESKSETPPAGKTGHAAESERQKLSSGDRE
jgi:CO/xanthine dehydrogenase Mo-binding subunit